MTRLCWTGCLLWSFCCFFACNKPTAPTQSDLPNVVLILADDMGYGDIHQYNPESSISTPNLDRLCQEGIMFTDAHTPSSVCSPTRYGLLTGRYAWRSRLKRFVLGGYSPHLIEPGRQTIAHLLQTKGYQTGIVGKWHLGLDWVWNESGFPEKGNQLGFVPASNAIDYAKAVAVGPKENGFGYSYVIPASLDIPPYVYLENNQVTGIPDSIYPGSPFPYFIRRGETGAGFEFDKTLQHLTDKASEFIQQQANSQQPFFLYLPLTAPHKPALPHAEFAGNSGIGPYGDLVMEVDDAIGRVLQTLAEMGIKDNTMVIYTSDNGSYMYRYTNQESDHVGDSTQQGYFANNHKANKDWRGTKADIWEAGHRVPFIVSYPKLIKGGGKIDQTICLTDVLASIAEVTQQPFDSSQSEDSYSFLPLLEGVTVNRPSVVHHSVAGMFALRKGRYKLVFGNGSGGRQQPRGEVFGKPYQLFDLESDPEETRDLAGDAGSAAMLEEMKQELVEILEKHPDHGVELEGI